MSKEIDAETMQVKVRPYDHSSNGKDSVIMRNVAKNSKWVDYSKVHPKQGFVIESSASSKNSIIGFIMYEIVKPESMTFAPNDIDSLTHSFQKLNVYDDEKYDDRKCDEKRQNEQELNDDKSNIVQLQVTHFFMIPSKRGRGIGASLLQYLIQSFPQKTKFGVDVAANNHIAINCFHKCGFVIKHQIKDYFGKNQNCLKMTLTSDYSTINSKIAEPEIAKYTMRFAQGYDDIEGIKKILYDIWPNQRDWGYPNDPITIVVEELFHGKRQIIGFVQCSWTLLEQAQGCETMRGKHWYLGVDFDEHYVTNRVIADYYDCEDLLEFNEYFDENELEWDKLRDHMLHIQQFAIDKNHRHNGLGSLLLKYVIHLFPKNTMFGLEVEAANINAVRLYKKNGFQVNRRVKNHYGEQRDGYKMIFISDCSMEENVEYLAEHQIVYKPRSVAKSYNNTITVLKDNKTKIEFDDDEKEDHARFGEMKEDEDDKKSGQRKKNLRDMIDTKTKHEVDDEKETLENCRGGTWMKYLKKVKKQNEDIVNLD